MIKSFFYLFIMLVLACGCETNVKPSYKLSDEQLAQLMLDIHLADVMLPELPAAYQDSIKEKMWERLTVIYHLSEEELKEEISKLESEPEKLKLVVNRAKELADSIQ